MKRLEVSVQSGNWYDECRPEESIRFIKECGFEGIDYNINNLFEQTFDKENLTSFFDKSLEELFQYFEPLKNAAQKYEVNISQLHGVFPMYFPEEDARNEYIIEVTEKMFAICEYFGGKNIVVHPWSEPTLRKEEEQAINFSFYRKLIPSARKHNLIICLENLFKHYDLECYDGALSNVQEAVFYVDALNEEAGEEIFGFCFDVGHAVVTGANLYHYITTLGDRLKLLHIHDNDGMSDSHMIPYTQMDRRGVRTRINWGEFLRGLKEIGYTGPLAFEVFRGIHILPDRVKPIGLQMVSEIGKYFRERLEE